MNIKKEMKKVGMAAMFTLAMTTSLFAKKAEKSEIKNEDPKKAVVVPEYTIELTINGMMVELSPIDVYAKIDSETSDEKIEPIMENDELAMLENADSFYEKLRIEKAIENIDNANFIF